MRSIYRPLLLAENVSNRFSSDVPIEIVTSNVAGTSFANDQTWIRLISRYDVGIAHPEAFFAFTNG